MKVLEFIGLLQARCEQIDGLENAEVIMASDAEGNSFARLEAVEVSFDFGTEREVILWPMHERLVFDE